MADTTEQEANAALRELQAELRRVLEQQAQATDARVRIASALGEMPYKQWPIIAAGVERRLAEDAATIERLRGELLDAITGQQVTDVPLPEMEKADD
jgi:hypothetical protein